MVFLYLFNYTKFCISSVTCAAVASHLLGFIEVRNEMTLTLMESTVKADREWE